MQPRTRRLMRMVLAAFKDQPASAAVIEPLLQRLEDATTLTELQQIAAEVLKVVPPEIQRGFPQQVAFCTDAVNLTSEEEWEVVAQNLHEALS